MQRPLSFSSIAFILSNRLIIYSDLSDCHVLMENILDYQIKIYLFINPQKSSVQQMILFSSNNMEYGDLWVGFCWLNYDRFCLVFFLLVFTCSFSVIYFFFFSFSSELWQLEMIGEKMIDQFFFFFLVCYIIRIIVIDTKLKKNQQHIQVLRNRKAGL